MIRYAVGRLLLGVVAVWVAATLAFLLAHLAPGGPAIGLGGENGAPGHIEAVNRALGLDRPLPVIYLDWLSRLVIGDLGYSWRAQAPVAVIIRDHAPVTLGLMVPALVLATLAGLPIGLWAASARNSNGWFAGALSALHALPSYVVAQALVFVFALGLGLFPVQGLSDPRVSLDGVARMADLVWRMTLPVLSLALLQMAFIALVARSRVAEEMARPYTKTAYAKGLGTTAVKLRHALPNAALPLVTLVGWRLGAAIGGSVVIETVFALPGLGRLAVTSASARDTPVVIGIVLVACTTTIAVNVLVDLIVRHLYPRSDDAWR
ncbi:ABC transporter permease [Phreatobacter oligotrophus]|uniref:Peptide/nickel transport system permease protein n=1 Tax=Phreatobacter oligotrophus TaxID=1122261 RepID=A0A2T4YS48_9HYPH|nr:ABC transporter permease [Phreatobacter oligotrophus]PTM46630.1 peptide/nickel transport system permease protein [Phreatobacter oligotrophus]